MHVYGTISGDTEGTWGLLREIEDVGPSGNDSGDIFTVNVIHNQVWYNITGAAGFFADEIGVGAYHNQTWDYQTTFNVKKTHCYDYHNKKLNSNPNKHHYKN